MGNLDLTPYSPRLLLQWEAQDAAARHQRIDGSLVFADVSGFTRLSERLARTRGTAGAEELVELISRLFGDLLTVAAHRGGEMLKFGGDAVLVLFRGDDHEARAAAGAWELQRRLREIGRVDTEAGPVRLRMSVGIASGGIDLFKVGRRHRELVIAGPVTTETARLETAAEAGEILVSAATASALPAACLGATRDGGHLLRRRPDAPVVPIVASPTSRDAALFVSEALRDHLGAEVEPEHRLATVAFVHLMGVDGLLATHDVRDVADRLDDSLTVVQDALAAFGVTFLATDLAVDGAKVMAASGAPLAGDDDERAMLLALRQAVASDAPLAIRAGANRGHVFAAAVGPAFRKTYTAMGDVTNTAARLLSRAGSGEVLVLPGVVEHAGGRFAVTPLPPFTAKGKREPLLPVRVDGVLDDAPAERTELPLVGRDTELECLLTAASAAIDGAGTLVELVGDMGSGKTRLIEEALRAAPLDRVVVHCEPYHRETPFHPVRRLLELVLPLDPEHEVSSLAEHVRAVAPDLAPWMPLLGDALELDVRDTEETRHLEPRFRRARTASTVVRLLRATLTSPTAIVVEDVHWMDEASSAVLGELESAAATAPWLVAVTRRDEAAPFRPRPSSTTIRLTPLTEPAMDELISLASDTHLPPHRREALVLRAAGNPLYLTELLQAGDDSLPDTLEAVIAAQIDRLGPSDRRLLRHAAVIGSRFDLDMLAAVADEPDVAGVGARALAGRLKWLCLPEGRGRLRFRHELIRDVAYGSLPFRQRRDLHARAAAVLEATSAIEHAGLLSLHYERANRHESCWRSAKVAARRACEKYANVEAVELLERAVRAARALPYLPDEELAETWQTLGERHALLGSMGPARAAYQRARRHARSTPAAYAKLCLKEARAAEREANGAAMDRWIRRGIRAVDGRDDLDGAGEILAELLMLGAWSRVSRGRPRQARAWAARALAAGESSGNQRAIAYALSVFDNVDAALGEAPDPSRAARALRIFRETGDLASEAVLLNNLGMDAYYRGRWLDALDLFERSHGAMTKVGNVIDAGYGSLNIAEILVEQGHLDRAESTLAELVPLWQSVDHALGLAYVDNHLGRIALHRGDAEGAIALLSGARDVFERNQLLMDALDADGRAAECLLRLGRTSDARALVDAALERDHAIGGTRVAARLQRVRAYAALAEGDTEGAWAAMDESLATARETSSPYDVALALEGFNVLAGGGPSRVSFDEIEGRALLDELGVVATPPPPVLTGA